MEDEHNDVQSYGMHSEDDKALRENNKKRTVKTDAQVQALEKFYNEHKYPTESMKFQLAEKIGLTEKQVSGWFCHRRLKDKRLTNGDNHVIVSGVIQDHGSGHRQDSCGSTKQVDDRNLDTREVESEKYSAAELTYEHGGHYFGTNNRTDDASSGSNSSLRNVSNNRKGNPFDVATSRYLVPKFPTDLTSVKSPRPGPAGYLKVKGQAENSAITAVKRQLGKHYREDGPPLGVEFDPLPPGAFESSMQNPDDGETCYTGDTVLPASPDFSKIHHQHPMFDKGCEYNSIMASHNSNMDRTSLKMPQGSDIPDNYVRQKYKHNTISTVPNNSACYPWRKRNPFVELPEISPREISGIESKDDYGTRYRKGAEVMRTSSFSSSHNLQPFVGNFRREQESSFHKFNNVRRNSSKGDTVENGSSNLTVKGFEYHNSFDQMQPRQIAKDGKTYADRRIVNENQIRIPYKNDRTDLKRTMDEFPQQLHLKKPSLVDNQLRTYQVTRDVAGMMPSGFSEDEASAETSSSVE